MMKNKQNQLLHNCMTMSQDNIGRKTVSNISKIYLFKIYLFYSHMYKKHKQESKQVCSELHLY